MSTSLDNNANAREAILGRVRAALKKSGSEGKARATAQSYLLSRPIGPQPSPPKDIVAHFIDRAMHMESTVECLSARDDIPAAVVRYIDALELPAAIAEQKSHDGVCWPELADLDWSGAGLSIEARPTAGDDRLGITGCSCAIAETGTLVFVSGPDMHTGTTLLPDTHIVVLRASDIVATMEDAFARVRAARPDLPRAINLISGPSRTGDIEQTIVLGAHGPYRVHILVLGVTR
ncbi:MAG TPA: lactate utilization protein [Casimicrobiaceae bacterium]|nr:lactate utilization protein [Casimicrobiaceae bacterium]